MCYILSDIRNLLTTALANQKTTEPSADPLDIVQLETMEEMNDLEKEISTDQNQYDSLVIILHS